MKEELHRQLPPVRGYPAHSAHASPPHPPLQTSKMSPFGQYPCFFSQCPKFRLILGIGNASFCFMPKISRLFEFFPEKTKIFGYWRKKAAYIPNLVIRPPTPYPPQKRKYAKKAAQSAGRLPFYLIQFPDGFRLRPGDCPRIPKHQPGNYSAAGASSASEAAPPPRFPSVIRNTISSLLT